MTVTVTHAKVSTKQDNPSASAAGAVLPSDWNADHVIEGFDASVSSNADVAANTAARHDAVTVADSAEIDFTLTGQEITASIKAASIDETKLDASVNASLDLADSAVQDLSDLGLVTSTTDNAIIRADGTAGGTQNSGVTIDDNDIMAGAKVLATGSSTARTLQARAADTLNILDFGGVGDNSTDNATAFAAALAALPTGGGTIFFPAGKYKFTSEVTFTIPDSMYSLRIIGAGQDATILTWSGATNGLTFTFQNLGNSFHISDLSITTSSHAGTGFGLSLVNNTITGTFQEGVVHNISNVSFQGDGGEDSLAYWHTALYIQALNFVNIDSVLVYGGSVSSVAKGRGIVITDITGIIIGTFNVSRSVLALLEIAVLISGNPQGVCLSQCTVIDSIVGLQTQLGTTTTQSLQISNCNFANSLNNIFIETPINDVQLSDTTFITNATAETANYSVYFGDISGFTIVGCEWLSAADTDTKALGIGATNGWPGIICGNTIRGPFDIGVELSLDSSLIAAYPNVFGSTVSTPYSDSGTNNKIRAKVEDGGTGLSSGTPGGVPYFSSSSAMASSAALAAHGLVVGGGAGAAPAALSDLGTTTKVLHGNASGDPTWSALDLAADITGVLDETNGGTGLSSFSQGDLIYASGENTLAKLAKDAGSSRFLKNSGTSNNPAWAQPAAADISGLAASATTDTTNAANISSGTLPSARVDLTANYVWSNRHDFFNNTSGDNARFGAGANYYFVGRNTSTGYMDFDGTQTGFIGYNFKSGPIVVAPGSSVTPTVNGTVTFQLTNNTTLTFKAKGSDGIVRSGTVTLS